MAFEITPAHADIFAAVEKGDRNLTISAVAGAGKTSVLVEVMKRIPATQSVLFVVFNKKNAEELKTRIGDTMPNVAVMTLNALGHRAYCGWRAPTKVEVKADKLRDITKLIMTNQGEFFLMGTVITKLCRLAKAMGVVPAGVPGTMPGLMPDSFETWMQIIDMYDVEMPEGASDVVVIDFARRVLRESLSTLNVIDFDDQLLMSFAYNTPFRKFDWVLADECLPYKTPVLLSDGTSKEIGDIVENKLDVSVLSFDPITRMQKPCKVTGYHKILNQKPLVKVKVGGYRRLSKKSGISEPAVNFVVCTIDHKIFADGEWVEAGKLLPGMKVQVETSADLTQAYKITSGGRKVLSGIMSEKNSRGVCGKNSPGGDVLVRGGNGTGMTVPQQVLLDALPGRWLPDHPISTHAKRASGYPTNYKGDLTNIENRIIVELDGASHYSRRDKDEKKTAWFEANGWKVIRFDNVTAVQKTSLCVEAVKSLMLPVEDCPVAATVISVSPVNIKDYYVYDITVEDCHDFYANGILVHNCQDNTVLQQELIARSVKPTGHLVGVGDENQACYFFRGAMSNSMDMFAKRFNAKYLPLHVSYRCPQSVVKVAQQYVPHIQAHASAPMGEVVMDRKPFDTVEYQVGDMVVCRTNAPLVKVAYSLLRKRVPCTVLGRDIGAGLVALVKKLRAHDVPTLIARLQAWEDKEFARFTSLGQDEKAHAAADKAATLRVFLETVDSIPELETAIGRMFSDESSDKVVTLSSIHRCKGRQSPRVFIINFDDMPLRWAKTPEAMQQELNLCYISLTRSQQYLGFIVVPRK